MCVCASTTKQPKNGNSSRIEVVDHLEHNRSLKLYSIFRQLQPRKQNNIRKIGSYKYL